MADTRKMVEDARNSGRDVPLVLAELIHALDDRIAALEKASKPRQEPAKTDKK